MKKGDIVIVRDSSYSKVVTKHGLEDGYGGTRVRGRQCVIIELDCRFPNPHQYQVKNNEYNNTVIRIIETDEIVFIDEQFLKPAIHKVMIDLKQGDSIIILSGKIVEISDELYQEIKRDSQTK